MGLHAGANLYSFVASNPIKNSDPFGLDALTNPGSLWGDFAQCPQCWTSFPGYKPPPPPDIQWYCKWGGRAISICADAASITAIITGAGIPVGVGISAISVENGYLSYKICGPAPSQVSTAVGAVVGAVTGYDKVSIAINIIDAALNAAGY